MPPVGVRRDSGVDLNPFRSHPVRRYAWAWSQLADRSGPHLDLGIGDGAPLLLELAARRGGAVVGADAHRGYLASARAADHDVPLVAVAVDGSLPFRDSAFDSATLLDVLEHVGDEHMTLSELARVLRPGALLVMSVPARHAWSWLDPDDLKYRLPRLHRWVMRHRYSPEEYRRRFLDDSDGLIGDLAANRTRHDNYDANELVSRVMSCGFVPRSRNGANLLGRPLEALRLLTSGAAERVVSRLLRADAHFRSAHLFLAFERSGDPHLA